MKKFSDRLVKDREFEIGGVILEWRYPFFDELATLYEEDQTNGTPDAPDPAFLRELYYRRIKQVEVFLTPESVEKWREISTNKDDPLAPFLIAELFTWLQEAASGDRPTMPPSGSEPGGGNTEASSPGGSPSTEETSAS